MPKWLQQINKQFSKSRWFSQRFLVRLVLLIVCLLVVAGSVYWYQLPARLPSGVQVGPLDLSGATRAEAYTKLSQLSNHYYNELILLVAPAELLTTEATGSARLDFGLPIASTGVKFDLDSTINPAFVLAESPNPVERLRFWYQTYTNGLDLPLMFTVDETKLANHITLLNSYIQNPGKKPYVEVKSSSPITYSIVEGEDGLVFDSTSFIETTKARLAAFSVQPISLDTKVISHQLTPAQISLTQTRLQTLEKAQVELVATVTAKEVYKFNLTSEQILPLVDPLSGGYHIENINQLLQAYADQLDRPGQDAVLKIESGKVVEFVPEKSGIALPLDVNRRQLISSLYQLESGLLEQPVNLVVVATKPDITLADTNDLGITELIGRGESFYKGSIAGRAHNVAHTANLINGVLIAPGDEFSFNKAVGPINRQTGFQSAYVIKDGRTVLGDGGGVCQASTTVFRAALNAGLEITKRQPHSYRVGYYEQASQPGYDATVYAPSVDLRFRNDTAHHILVATSINKATSHLIIDIYGTSDGRVSLIDNYRQWGAQAAPAPLYQEDPTLPVGITKQVDWAAPGLKTAFDYTVTRGGVTLHQETFNSNYRPWRAVYLVGTKQ